MTQSKSMNEVAIQICGLSIALASYRTSHSPEALPLLNAINLATVRLKPISTNAGGQSPASHKNVL